MLALPWRDNEKVFVKGKEIVFFEKQEEKTEGGCDTTGTIFWDAAVVLLKYLEENEDDFNSKEQIAVGKNKALITLT